VISAGGFRVWPQGFEFTLLTLGDVSSAGSAWLAGVEPARSIALHLQERGRDSLLTVRYTAPAASAAGPRQVRLLDEESSDTGEMARSRRWVTPLPPPGLVELAVRLGGDGGISGAGYVDGQVIAEAGAPADA
jgi:hypothetical protein